MNRASYRGYVHTHTRRTIQQSGTNYALSLCHSALCRGGMAGASGGYLSVPHGISVAYCTAAELHRMRHPARALPLRAAAGASLFLDGTHPPSHPARQSHPRYNLGHALCAHPAPYDCLPGMAASHGSVTFNPFYPLPGADGLRELLIAL